MAAGYLLDTNVISETRRIRPDAGVLSFLQSVSEDDLFLSVLTLGELRRGVALKRRTDADAAAQVGAWVDGIETLFAARILPLDTAAARLWGELSAERTLPVVDTLIASIALSRDLTFVTRNRRDVASTGVTLLDPWSN